MAHDLTLTYTPYDAGLSSPKEDGPFADVLIGYSGWEQEYEHLYLTYDQVIEAANFFASTLMTMDHLNRRTIKNPNWAIECDFCNNMIRLRELYSARDQGWSITTFVKMCPTCLKEFNEQEDRDG